MKLLGSQNPDISRSLNPEALHHGVAWLVCVQGCNKAFTCSSCLKWLSFSAYQVIADAALQPASLRKRQSSELTIASPAI